MRRPVGVTVLATLSILSALFGVVWFCLFALGVEWFGTLHEHLSGPTWFRFVPAVARLAISGLYLILGVGLWRLRRWARRALVLWCLAGVAISFTHPFIARLLLKRWEASFFALAVLASACCLLCLWYMATTNVKRAFGV